MTRVWIESEFAVASSLLVCTSPQISNQRSVGVLPFYTLLVAVKLLTELGFESSPHTSVELCNYHMTLLEEFLPSQEFVAPSIFKGNPFIFRPTAVGPFSGQHTTCYVLSVPQDCFIQFLKLCRHTMTRWILICCRLS